jgi:hypothetical protein
LAALHEKKYFHEFVNLALRLQVCRSGLPENGLVENRKSALCQQFRFLGRIPGTGSDHNRQAGQPMVFLHCLQQYLAIHIRYVQIGYQQIDSGNPLQQDLGLGTVSRLVEIGLVHAGISKQRRINILDALESFTMTILFIQDLLL